MWVPQEERGRLVVFPSNLKKSFEIGQCSIEKGLGKMSQQSIVRAVISGGSSAIGTVSADCLVWLYYSKPVLPLCIRV
jgi:hypothetical protein